jgi:protein tyrosine phosphatase
VRELFGGNWWVATQAPLPNTMHAFLSMLFQPLSHLPASFRPPSSSHPAKRIRIRTVVQLTDGNTRMGHHAYIPLDVGESLTMAPEKNCDAPSLKVTLLERQTINEAQCIQSTVSILPISSSTSDQEEPEPIVFRHILYSSWPDHGVPESREHFIRFLRLVDRMNKDVSLATSHSSDAELDPDPPIMIHCSAGVGRTGTLIATMSLLRAWGHLTQPPTLPTTRVTAVPGLAPSPLGPLPESVEKDMVVNEVDSMREQRPGMVQKDQQILYIYEVFALGLGLVRAGVTSE